ncbi:hypothetical protein [Stenotrophomonas acidaminiphila]
MKLELVKYKCAKCANAFEAPEIGSDSYGEFLLRSPSGVVVYLDALQDKTYEEVDQLLAANERTGGLSAFERAQVLRHVYGEIACDKDANGNSFTLGAHPACPFCGSQEMVSWEFKEPPELMDVHLDFVTHRRWDSLSEGEKIRLLEKKLVELSACWS